MQTKRIPHFDALKVFAAYLVLSGHFLEDYAPPQLFAFWKQIFLGSTGKLGVAIFCVIMGALAYHAGAARKKPLLDYALKRYVCFAVSIAFVDFLTLAYSRQLNLPMLKVLLADTLTLDCKIWPVGWCIRGFFIGSVAAFLCGRSDCGGKGLIFLAAVCLPLNISLWISLCILGGCFFVYRQPMAEFFVSRPRRTAAAIGCFLILWGPESSAYYFLYGVVSLLFLFVLDSSPKALALCGKPIFARLGSNAMAFYLIHKVSTHLCADFCFRFLDRTSSIQALCVMVAAYLCNIALSFPAGWLLNTCADALSRLCTRLARAIPL